MSIFEIFCQLAETIIGQAIEGQLARDVVGLISALFGFGLLVLIALTPFYVLQALRVKK